MQPTPLDIAIAGAILISVLGACHRGLGREMLHTVLFAILVAIGYVLFRNTGQTSENETVFWLVNSTYYLLTAYVLTWVIMRILSPLILGHENTGLRSRFWAGVLSLAKLGVVIIGLNLWYAVHSPEAHPKRLEALPPVMRNSVLIRINDRVTENLYLWLAQNNILTYHKITDAPPTQQEINQRELEETLGVSPSTLLPDESLQ